MPADTGVCTDEIIRSYRALAVDLQKEVHEDMAKNFSAYPRRWGRTQADSNIDHRRVPNLMIFFNAMEKRCRSRIRQMTMHRAIWLLGIWVGAYRTLVL